MAHITANGVALHIQRLRRQSDEEQPEGPVVVFIHGLVVDNMSSLYYSLANPVAQEGAEAILYDMRGHGRSDSPATGYTLEDSMADLVGLLDAMDLRAPVHLVGHSYGASVALRTALTHPGRIASLVLIEPHCSGSGDGGDWVEDIADLLTASALGFDHNPVPGDLSAADQRRARSAQAANSFLNCTSMIEDVASSPPFTDDELEGLDCPVLAIYGQYTDLAPSARKLAQAVPRCRLEVIAGIGHSVLRDARDDVLGLVTGWLSTDGPPCREPRLEPVA